MKRTTAILALLLSGIATGADATCTGDDLVGSWYAKYRFGRPFQQVGECQFVIDRITGLSGSCYNWTYGLNFTFFDAFWSIKKNCRFKAVADLDDGQRLTLNGKLFPRRGFAKGAVKGITNRAILHGKFKMQRN